MIAVGWRCLNCWQMGKVHVRNRAEGEDIVKWMEKEIAEQAGLGHAIASPRCNSGKVDLLMRFHKDDQWIGQHDVLMEGPLRWDLFDKKKEPPADVPGAP